MNNNYTMMTTIKEVRNSFWENYPQYRKGYKKVNAKKPYYTEKRQNDYCTDIRCAFVDYVDYLLKDDIISEKLAQRVTL